MKMKEIKALSDKELHTRLRESRGKLGDLRFQVSADQHKGVRDVRNLRTDIARMLTELTRRQQEKKA